MLQWLRKVSRNQGTESSSEITSSPDWSDLAFDAPINASGNDKKLWITREEWYSPGERFGPDERNLNFSASPVRCEFIEISRCHGERGPSTLSKVIGTIGEKIHQGQWQEEKFVIRCEKGPDLKTWLDKVPRVNSFPPFSHRAQRVL
jgi:hypothetical protein